MTCEEAEPLLSACLDCELDLIHTLKVEKHLTGCDACAGKYRKLEWLRSEIAAVDLDWSAETDLRAMRKKIVRRPTVWRSRPYLTALATAAAMLLAVVFVRSRLPGADDYLDRQVVDNHVRSLLVEHLVDVPSSDRHTVKPWFQGKLDFSPNVPDLSKEGFVLIGGRLDVMAGRQAAAIIYKRQNHVINLWISSGAGQDRAPELRDLNGFHLLRWQSRGVSYWAVSDLNAAELGVFGEMIRSR